METFIVQPKDEVQIKVLRSILEAFEMPYEIEPEALDVDSLELEDETERLKRSPKTAALLNESIRQSERGETVTIKLEDLWK